MSKKTRQAERAFTKHKAENQNKPLQDVTQANNNRKRQTGPKPAWTYKLPAVLFPLGGYILTILGIQVLMSSFHNIMPGSQNEGVFANYGMGGLYFIILILVVPCFVAFLWFKFRASWINANAMFLDDDISEYTNDSYIRTIDNLTSELEVAPDTGLGFDGHVSTLMGHMMVSNKGINKIDMPQRDKSVDGLVARDDDGNIITKKVPMFNEAFADKLFSMSGVPQEFRTLYDATDYDFNRKLTRKEGGGKDEDGNWKRAGVYDRKQYDKLSDFINNEFYPLDTDTERPAGVYFYDRRPVNTILISITRGGKGQTYIEPSFDVWTREKHKWNIFTTDPKGELLAKFYYPATVRGYDIVQFNLMHPNLTNVYNPLANAVQAFRQNNPVKGSSLIDSIVDTLFPDNGEIWNSAAGNMFRRAVYMLFDYYIEQENYIRYLGHKNGTPQDLIDSNVDKNYEKVTLFNLYSLIGELAASTSKDTKFINVDPDVPPVTEKDLLTLMFDAMSVLPTNGLRSKAITANNAIKQIASAEQTIAGIYATLLTGLSVYADDTAIALMSGSLNESFDVAGLGFPRRIGIHFDDEYVKKFRIQEELCKWTIYRDKDFTDQYEGKDFTHSENISSSNWVWGYFAGIFDQEVTYIKATIYTKGGTVAKEFFFEFKKGYKKYDDISYVLNPITHKKMISNGTLIELDPVTKEHNSSSFTSRQMDLNAKRMSDVTRPAITSNQVFYAEQPKFVFAITPPHLQVYQKHILIIIKQILDEQYANSYVVKENRKPIVGTRLMLEEFGNIRSGENGIPNIDTATSIALGQNVQITFVLQSFQQLRAIYKEDVEKIIRSNSANTIFLKSNDEELINELVRQSGTKHDFRVKSKSVSRKVGDMIEVGDPVINYSGENGETTALTANDLLFLAGPNPGNSITFSSGEMPIVGKLDTITPMAAGMHSHLPQPAGGQYSDSTLPSTKAADSVNYMENMIDGEALVRARVAQARIWLEQKKIVEGIEEREEVTVSERDGSLSALVMNYVYEQYDRDSGQNRSELAEPIVYWKMAKSLYDDSRTVSNTKMDPKERLAAADRIRENLARCTMDSNLDEMTAKFKDTEPVSPVNMGYNEKAIMQFIIALREKYPQPADMKIQRQDMNEYIGKMRENASHGTEYQYHDYSGNEEVLFDILNPNHTNALDSVIMDSIEGIISSPQGVDIMETPDNTNKGYDTSYEVSVGGTPLYRYDVGEELGFQPTELTDEKTITRKITDNNVLVQQIQDRLINS